MINAQRHTLFGAGHGIVSPRQTDFAASAQKANFLCSAGVVCHSLVNARPSRAPQGHAGVAGQVNVQRGRLHCYLERPLRVGWHC